MRILCILALALLVSCGSEPPTAAPPPPPPPAIGQDVPVGLIIWHVDSVKDGGKVLEGNGHQDRAEWGFVIIDTTITNNGAAAIKIVPPVLYTTTHAPIKYAPTQEMILLNDHTCGYSLIAPKETKLCQFIYELLPDGGTAARLEVSDFAERDSQGAFIELIKKP